MSESIASPWRAYRSRQTVRFGDVDPADVVYYPRILHYCHVAMEEFFDAVLGITYAEVVSAHRFGLPTVRLEVDFVRPLRYGDEIEVEVEVRRLGTSAVDWRYTIHRPAESQPAARVEAVTVGVDLESFAKVSIPDWLREALGEARWRPREPHPTDR